MTTTDQSQNDEKASQAKATNEAELAKWEGDFKEEDLKIPYKRDDSTKTDPKKDESAAPDDSDDEETEDNKPVVTYSEPEPVITVEDPGEYTPGDHSFEVILKDGKTHKITTPEEADKIADDPDNFETPKQLMDFLVKSNKMQRNIDRDYEKWQEKKSIYDEQSETEQTRRDTVNNLVKGFEYLVSKGYIPAVSPEDATADWSDPEVSKHPGVKEQIDLINYMTKENESREKAGVPILASALDAYNAWQLDSNRKKSEAEHRAQGEARKAAGARVSGVSPSQQGTYVPNGIAVGNPNVFKRSSTIWED